LRFFSARAYRSSCFPLACRSVGLIFRQDFFFRPCFPRQARSVLISSSVSQEERATGFPLPLSLSRFPFFYSCLLTRAKASACFRSRPICSPLQRVAPPAVFGRRRSRCSRGRLSIPSPPDRACRPVSAAP
jgi:hypothetical protein